MENLVVHLKIIIDLKEKVFAVQKDIFVGKITQIYHNYKDKKNITNFYFASYHQASEISYFINLRGEIPFPPKFSHVYVIKPDSSYFQESLNAFVCT